jgi:heme/copper-type cytochrome/quinol oxidase subunit 4
MLEEKKASRWGRWLVLVVLLLVLIYVIADGWVMNKLEPNEVVAVYDR